MSGVTQILTQIEQGDALAAEKLLPLVYDELRHIAAHKLGQEKAGQTLQTTALVHEAYIRLVDSEQTRNWNSRGYFFAAAAEAMRRILVERARRKAGPKQGGHLRRVDLDPMLVADDGKSDDLLFLDDALRELEKHDAQSANLVKLRYFAGLTHQEAAEALGLTRRSADRLWALARAWLFQQFEDR